jgi:hypothetical protein
VGTRCRSALDEQEDIQGSRCSRGSNIIDDKAYVSVNAAIDYGCSRSRPDKGSCVYTCHKGDRREDLGLMTMTCAIPSDEAETHTARYGAIIGPHRGTLCSGQKGRTIGCPYQHYESRMGCWRRLFTILHCVRLAKTRTFVETKHDSSILRYDVNQKPCCACASWSHPWYLVYTYRHKPPYYNLSHTPCLAIKRFAKMDAITPARFGTPKFLVVRIDRFRGESVSV